MTTPTRFVDWSCAVLARVPSVTLAALFVRLGIFVYPFFWRRDFRFRADVIATVLHESLEQAGVIAISSYAAQLRFWVDTTLMAFGGQRFVEQRLNQFRCADRSVIALIRETTKPVVLIGLHMGSYLAGAVKLAECIGNKKALATFSLGGRGELESRAYAHVRTFVEKFEVIPVDDRAFVRARTLLRQGTVVGTFLDLPDEYGRTQSCEMLGWTANLLRAPLLLAATTGSLVVALVTFCDANGIDNLVLCAPEDASPRANETLAARIERVGEYASRSLGGYIRRTPGNWLQWPIAQSIFVRPVGPQH